MLSYNYRSTYVFKWAAILCLLLWCCQEDDIHFLPRASNNNFLLVLQSQELSVDIKTPSKDTVVVALPYDHTVLKNLKNKGLVFRWKISEDATLKLDDKVLLSGKSLIPFISKATFFYQNIFVVSESGKQRKYTLKILMKELVIPVLIYKISKKSIAGKDILSKIKNAAAYQFKNFESVSPAAMAAISEDKTTILLKKTGTFTAQIVLEHKKNKTATARTVPFKILKGDAVKLNFIKLSKPLSASVFTEQDIFENIKGSKEKYQIKHIENINPAEMAAIGSDKKSVTMGGKIGNFTCDIVLEHPLKEDSKIQNAAFEVTKEASEKLTFKKLTKLYEDKVFAAQEIFKNIQGKKDNYTIEAIKNIQPEGMASVLADKTSLNLKKIGHFSADLVLKHPVKKSVTIRASFEIKKAAAEKLGFNMLLRDRSDRGDENTITKDDIESKLAGKHQGYRLKRILNVIPRAYASVKPGGLALTVNKNIVGPFVATLVFEHPSKENATIHGRFVIRKSPAENLSITETITKTYGDSPFDFSDIQSKIIGDDGGYVLKAFKHIIPGGLINLSADTKSMRLRRGGDFTATVVLEHPLKKDAIIENVNFRIDKTTAEILSFNKVSKEHSTSGRFTAVDILGGVTGNKDGYTVKEIKNLNPNNIVIVSADKTYLIFKPDLVGNFKATVVLEHPTKKDAIINLFEFEIRKMFAANLLLLRIEKTYSPTGSFLHAEILTNIRGAKTGYTIQEIKNLRPTGVVSIRADKMNLDMRNSALAFVADIILTHPTRENATILGAPFRILKRPMETLNFPELTKPYSAGDSFSESEIYTNVDGTKTGYVIKSINNVSDKDLAEVGSDGKSLDMKTKAGSFTANIVLEHPTKLNSTIINAHFKIEKAPKETLTWKGTIEKKYTDTYSGFGTTEIFDNIDGTKLGYTIKEIQTLTPNIAKLTADKKGILFDDALGDFTATIILEHPTKKDTQINGATFKINKGAAERLTFDTYKEYFEVTGLISSIEIFNHLQGKKTGYQLQEIRNLSGLSGLDPISVDKKSIKHLKAMSGLCFTADLRFENPLKETVEITGAEFCLSNRITFEKLYGTDRSISAYSVVENSDDSFVIAMQEDISKSARKNIVASIVKMDKYGNKIWNYNYGKMFSSQDPNDITKTNDGGYVFVVEDGYTAAIVKIDKDGKKVWEFKTDLNWVLLNSVIQDSEGNYVAVGSVNEMLSSGYRRRSVFAIKLDSSGNLLWKKINAADTTSSLGSESFGVVENARGNYVVAGYRQVSGTDSKGNPFWGRSRFWLLELDKTNGAIAKDTAGKDRINKIFGVPGKHRYMNRVFSLVKTTEGDYVMVGSTGSSGSFGASTRVWVIKTDETGKELWRKTLDYSDGFGRSVDQDREGNLILSAGYNAQIIKLDKDGNKMFAKRYQGDASSFIHCIIATKSGGYLGVGHKYVASESGSIWILKTDKDGEVDD